VRAGEGSPITATTPGEDVAVPLEPAVVVGLYVEPGASHAAGTLAHEVERALVEAHPGLTWTVRAVEAVGTVGSGGEVDAPAGADAGSLLARAREVLLAEDLDVAVLVTDRDVRLNGRPVAAQTSPVQQSVVVSLPGLGPTDTPATAVADLVCRLLEAERPGEGSARVLRELAAEQGRERSRMWFTLRTLSGSARLLARMVLANRPWLLAARLTRTLVGAFAGTVVAIVTPDVWMLADRMEPVRLAGIAILVLVATTGVLVIGGRLRERAPSGRVRRTVLIHNTAVWVSVTLGVGTLFAGLVVASLATVLLVLPWGLVAETVGHSVGWSTMLRVGALASVVALVGSAFGAGLEDDAAVQRAAYTGSDDAEYLDD
jgi:uncharacterized membrane protein